MNKVLSSILASVAVGTAAAAAPSQPNIVVILLDDVGFSDYGCYGSEVPTPNIDRLAANGIRTSHFYNQARSGPTRASLMTGLYPHQVGYGALRPVEGHPNYQGYPNENNIFIPAVLQSAGYYTFLTGKWHLLSHKGVKPTLRGFDRSIDSGAGALYFPSDKRGVLNLDDKRISFTDERLPNNESWYSTELWTNMGLEFVDEAMEQDKPFFWYLAHTAAHFPLQAPAETIVKYKGRYSDGWEALREERFAKQKSLGLFAEDTELTPLNPLAPDWESLSDEQKETFDTQMAIYCAVIEEIDKSIGVLLDELEQRGVLDNTMIVLLNDNGGNGEPDVYGKFILDGNPAGGANSTVFLGAAWAGLANTPYFLYKHHGHEGGCNTPLIISYPNGIDKKLCGTIIDDSYGHLIDIMPTLVEVSGATYPTVHKGHNIPAMEGCSLTPLFTGGKIKDRPIIIEHEGNKALRYGDYKIVKELSATEWRLYNLKKDPTEMHDISVQQGKKLRSMVAEYERMAEHIGVDPALDARWTVGKWYTPVDKY